MTPELEALVIQAATVALAYARGFLEAFGIKVPDELAAQAPPRAARKTRKIRVIWAYPWN